MLSLLQLRLHTFLRLLRLLELAGEKLHVSRLHHLLLALAVSLNLLLERRYLLLQFHQSSLRICQALARLLLLLHVRVDVPLRVITSLLRHVEACRRAMLETLEMCIEIAALDVQRLDGRRRDAKRSLGVCPDLVDERAALRAVRRHLTSHLAHAHAPELRGAYHAVAHLRDVPVSRIERSLRLFVEDVERRLTHTFLSLWWSQHASWFSAKLQRLCASTFRAKFVLWWKAFRLIFERAPLRLVERL